MSKIGLLPEEVQATLFQRLGVEKEQDLKFLGRGSFADTYWLPDKTKVFKITRDKTDAITSAYLIGKKPQYIIRTYEVFQLSPHLYGIINEKLLPLSGSQTKKWKELVDIYHNMILYGERVPKLSQSRLTVKWVTQFKEIVWATLDDLADQLENEFDALLLFASELEHYHIQWSDLQAGNILNRGHTSVISDLGGNSSSPGGASRIEQLS